MKRLIFVKAIIALSLVTLITSCAPFSGVSAVSCTSFFSRYADRLSDYEEERLVLILEKRIAQRQKESSRLDKSGNENEK